MWVKTSTIFFCSDRLPYIFKRKTLLIRTPKKKGNRNQNKKGDNKQLKKKEVNYNRAPLYVHIFLGSFCVLFENESYLDVWNHLFQRKYGVNYFFITL